MTLETLSDHNERVGSANIACDKCGSGMNYDREKIRMERHLDMRCFPGRERDGKPVVCPKCGYSGRMLGFA